MLCNLNVGKAEEMYDFLIKDMQGIPDIEPAQQSFLERFGEQANGIFGWLRDNQDMLGQGVEFLRGIIRKNGGAASSPLPPING